MDLTKNNSVLVPKQRLFAPMLGTFGGGSARGMGRGLGKGLGLYRILMIGGGGGRPNDSSFQGTGGAGGVAMFDLEIPSGTSIAITAGGKGASQTTFGGGGGFTRVQISSLGFDAVVGAGGGGGYRDMGGLGGGLNINGTHGYDYPGGTASTSGQMQDGGNGAGGGGDTFSGAGGTGGSGGGSTGGSGGSFSGGVYPYPGDSYPGGNGGSGYYGGGAGGGNNGQGGGPGGGGSGYLNLGSATGYNNLINAAHQTLNINLFSTSATYHYSRNETMDVQYGSIDYRYPPDYTTTGAENFYAVSHWHQQISTTDSRFTTYKDFGGGGRRSRGSQPLAGIVHIIEATSGTQLASVSGNASSAANANSGNVTQTVTT